MASGCVATVLVLSSLCASPTPAVAQVHGSPQQPNLPAALGERVKPGDLIAVRLTTGEDVVGAFSGASSSSVTLTTMAEGVARRIPAEAVREIVLRRGGNRLKRGIAIGVPLGAWFGTAGCYQVETPGRPDTGSSCGASVLAGAAIVGGVGALIGRRVWHPAVLYSAGPAPSTDATGQSAEAPVPVPSLSALATRLQPFDTVYARGPDRRETVGHFVSASDASLRLEIDGQMREIPASELQEVASRGGTRVRVHLLRGFLVGAAVGSVVLLLSDDYSDEWTPGAALFLGAIGGGAIGLQVGAVIGAFDHERRVVYRRAGPLVRVAPMLGPDRRGAMMSIQF